MNKSRQTRTSTKKKIIALLSGGDLRSVGRVEQLIAQVRTQRELDQLIGFLRHEDRKVVMRAADAIEKITVTRPRWLHKHKKELLELCLEAREKELKWHLAALIPRLPLTKAETGRVWALLTAWAMDRRESRIVRAFSVQALHDLLPENSSLQRDFDLTVTELYREQIPSLRARIRKLTKGRIQLPDDYAY